MLQLIYIFAFTIVAFLAIANLIRSLINLSSESQRLYPNNVSAQNSQSKGQTKTNQVAKKPLHPELLDAQGKIINEPLLVMRSVSVEDARQQLDSIYNSSPNKSDLEE
ncbi:hypothetical protein Sta7437_0059 [Stanieria cyanosphaera PCC 7437]|uniref:DUF2973 domain-containing protein n=1 Tax=Stanieria cyanosphaera (strain ATCC 29371 / PCC 7437) TaxID=111780 RepID=K9XNR5_STAC7|nr:DUF2973 domain-containing protein [Stanieria cyanosphaera]AFZ33681.1 hypothetical protein Sta7437_0059 [Stanieria cyanosphaera PCC 7437]